MTRIDKTRWQVISPWLDQLLDAEPAARVARLDIIRQGDCRLAAELAALLAGETAANRGAFLEGQVLGGDIGVAGATVGGWTLLSVLGHGGTSTVWLARRRQEAPVAIKLPSPTWHARTAQHLFQREAGLLARLSHPNIARLLATGLAQNGQPYLVLEHVNGLPIDRWCAARALGIEARAQLFIDVLAAVSHTHERRVLHLDLKPANILVSRDGEVKLLDFGIARRRDDAGPSVPAGGAFTPDFAAPEQVLHQRATPATDVYALGVLLHVLLSGCHPTSTHGATPAERLRAIVDDEPVPVSVAAVRCAEPAAAEVDRDPHAEVPAARPPGSRGDLDAIVAKALKKRPAERYATPAAMAYDLRRHLARAACRSRLPRPAGECRAARSAGGFARHPTI
jgi:eukaryotic-like serine/threonine-protein kinase